ncbi:25771_t:CDS:2, partial [Racocetra persica]
ATIVYGILMLNAFGEGLKKFFVKSSAKPNSPDEEANIETQDIVSSPKMKVLIDD